eukprot:6284271-Alexandrium_andersonii.AAC.1
MPRGGQDRNKRVDFETRWWPNGPLGERKLRLRPAGHHENAWRRDRHHVRKRGPPNSKPAPGNWA